MTAQNTIKLAPWFAPLWNDYGNYDYAICYGGRGRGATESIARLVAYAMLYKTHSLLCSRKHYTDIKQSNLPVIKDAIRAMGFARFFNLNLERKIVCKVNGAVADFKGIDKSLDAWRSLAGYNIIWLEESHEMTDEQLDIILPSLRNKHQITLFASYNPCLRDAPIERLLTMPKARSVFATYKDNPYFPMRLEELRRRDAEMMDEARYRWIWDGEYRPQDELALIPLKLIDKAYNTTLIQEGGRYAGIDIAGSETGDYTAIVILSENGAEIHSDNVRIRDMGERKQWLLTKLQAHRCEIATIDITGGRGEAEMEWLNENDIATTGFKFTSPSKKSLLDRLHSRLAMGAVSLKNKTLYHELVDLGETGKAITGHDDLVMALALAILSLPESDTMVVERDF